jgi:hypothetical protein
MKRIWVLLLMLFVGCSTDANDQATIKWLSEAKKPVICTKGVMNGMNYDQEYTLIDADGKIYTTGYTTLRLPDTLKGGNTQ